jgi:hypothetical protein
MNITVETIYHSGALVGSASYVLLITSMMMTRITSLRALAVASGVLSIYYSAYFDDDMLSAFWETLFVVVNLAQLAIIVYRNSMARFTPEERAFYEIVVPGLAPAQVRSLLNEGRWIDAEPGVVLAQQGELVPDLVFLYSGEVSVSIDDQCVGTCGAGDFVGEISVSTGIPATANAVATTPLRYLAFDRVSVMRLINRPGEIGQAVEQSFRHGMREKLIRTSQAIAFAARPAI